MRLVLHLAASCLMISAGAGIASAQSGGVGAVGDNYESISGPVECNGGAFCPVLFAANTTGRVVLVDTIGCVAVIGALVTQLYLASTVQSSGPPTVKKLTGLTLPQPEVLNGAYYYSVNSTAKLLLGLGKVPFVAFYTGSPTDFQISCTLSGTFAQ